jgi:hypothetical protein
MALSNCFYARTKDSSNLTRNEIEHGLPMLGTQL